MKPALLFCVLLLPFAAAAKPAKIQSTTTDTLNYTPPGKLYDIGGYRMHLNVVGKGKNTIVLITGAFGFSFDWTFIQRALSKEAKVCTYDRPGLAWSDIGPMPHTLQQDAYELHKLLKAAKVRAPYILVGQSVGGLIARVYAKTYPNEVNGMVLVDATSENGLFGVKGKIERMRTLASEEHKVPGIKDHVDEFTKTTSAEKIKEFLKIPHPVKISRSSDLLQDSLQNFRSWANAQPKVATAEGGAYWPEEFAAIYADSLSYRLSNKPLIVLTSIKNEYPKGWDMRDSMMTDKLNNQKRFLKLSTNSKLVTTENSGHEIHIKEPALVIEAIRQVIKSINNKSMLE